MNECARKCMKEDKKCQKKECRRWIDYGEDLNCVEIAVKKNSAMTLHEVAKRLGISYVRVSQIEKHALTKLQKKVFTD